MAKQAIGLIIKGLVREKKIPLNDITVSMGFSRQSIYHAYSKDTMPKAEIERWEVALKMSKGDLYNMWQNSDGAGQGSSPESSAFAQETVDRIIGELKAQYETRLAELKNLYESRISELKDQTGDLREQLKFNREMVQAFKEGHLGKSEGAPIRPFSPGQAA